MPKTAVLYRMVTEDHICPYGIKSKDLLRREGFEVEDNHLTTREETDDFKEEHGVKTTPQTFINGERIGGYDALLAHLGKTSLKQEGTTYQPVIAVFVTTFLMALSASYAIHGTVKVVPLIELFIAFSMCVLAILKLRDLFGFSNQFVSYDVVAQRFVPYAYIYPFVEMGAGVLMISGLWTWVAAPAALVVSSIGAFSVFKAVYVEKRELKCACVGGDSDVPLGFVSLTENLMMMAMAVWMMLKAAGSVTGY